MKIIAAFFLLVMAYASASAQVPFKKLSQLADLAVTFGESENSIAASYIHNWSLGKKHRWELGAGIRTTSYFGVKRNYITAPARLARSTTIPFVIVLAAQEEQNFDTLTVQRPLTFSTNLTFNAGYHFSPKWYGGLNIDVIGFTVGRTTSALLASDGATTLESKAKPAAFNLLLTGDNDLGSLNSEFYLRYNLSTHWGIRGVYQFLFSEYKTSSPDIYQVAPDGTKVTRFRNKVNAFGVALTYVF